MVSTRVWTMGMTGALVAAAALVAPAFGASEGGSARTAVRRVTPVVRAPGTFTPAAADPRLAAMFARGGFDPSGFRFTPAETGRATRGVTVAVRARTARPDAGARAVASTGNVGIAPIAYSLGAAVGWKRVTIAGDMNRVDLAQQPGGREVADVAVTYAAGRISGKVKGAVDRPMLNLPLTGPLSGDIRSYSIDASTSYALTRNLDVTAGVRYRTDRERLVRELDPRHESQAVYVGTAFRF